MNPLQLAITGALDKLMGTNTSQRMLFSASEKLKAQLSHNMLVSGKVETDLGRGNYTVRFFKESVVVHSKSPLTVNELIHGRVIGIDEKVELQRVYKNKAAADNQSAKQANWEQLKSAGSVGNRAVEVLQNYRSVLSTEEQMSLLTLLKKGSETEALILSAVVLNKLGIRVNEVTLNTLYPMLSKTLNVRFNLQNMMAHVDFESPGASANIDKHITELASYIAAVANEIPEHEPRNDRTDLTDDVDNELQYAGDDPGSGDERNGRQQDKQDFDANLLLLNSQSDSSVSHRVSVVPFVINERLVEVDMALFSQKERNNQDSIEHKKIALSLDMDTLGQVDIEINMANKHARINIKTENNLTTNEMVKYMPELKQDLTRFDIKIDELSYGVIDKNELGHVISSVVEHYISQDSLSRVY